MNLAGIDKDWVVEKIEFAKLHGERARSAGANARLGVHGKACEVSLVRITIDGKTAYGASHITKEQAEKWKGRNVRGFFGENGNILEPYRIGLEYPLLDWLGRRWNQPVYELVQGTSSPSPGGFAVPCYDTSLYFDDLHLTDDKDAVKLIQEEAKQGYAKGHRHFKIKVGRGGMHMPLTEGTRRDIAIVEGVREVAGPDGKLMIDANNGYNLNLTKQVLTALSGVGLYWIEEMFHEDNELYKDLKLWLKERDQKVLIADGEGYASPRLVDWATQGYVDVLQYDIIHPGFTHWLELGAKLDEHGLFTAPHCYGNAYGIYATGHLSAAIRGFQFVEWDDITIHGMDASAYSVKEGKFYVPPKAGFGLEFDDDLFTYQVSQGGWIVE
ncbi:mandelate racemase [Paenibacillus antri]|uniref:Mandelate racemase n=1 Tax=Paenibacillus antri TaxID=2582848 RepID=A0A5R9G7Q1_9BACL|nr:enolase C-terminal domain-like protein [Paenibacillus antri]TLS52447.1 mandelate racemase [Paenibacillus antri]